jgi:hypothetical protein
MYACVANGTKHNLDIGGQFRAECALRYRNVTVDTPEIQTVKSSQKRAPQIRNRIAISALYFDIELASDIEGPIHRCQNSFKLFSDVRTDSETGDRVTNSEGQAPTKPTQTSVTI